MTIALRSPVVHSAGRQAIRPFPNDLVHLTSNLALTELDTPDFESLPKDVLGACDDDAILVSSPDAGITVYVFPSPYSLSAQQVADRKANRRIASEGITDEPQIHLVTFQDELTYRPFSSDFGPLNIGMTWRFCKFMKHLEQVEGLGDNPLFCIFTSKTSEARANFACLTALYLVLEKGFAPWEAFAPFASKEFRPFRDACTSRADYGISIQDCIRGLHLALTSGLLNWDAFDIARYEVRSTSSMGRSKSSEFLHSYKHHELSDHGDLNTVGPFVPFASPYDPAYVAQKQREDFRHERKERRFEEGEIPQESFEEAFDQVVKYLKEEDVGAVFRLNEDLYDSQRFRKVGIEVIEMEFPDGSCPPPELIEEFIKLANDVIERGKTVAVHCRAGLGRTGVMIGGKDGLCSLELDSESASPPAYLISKYGFSANEVIAYMRLIRPGMVVGCQQHFLWSNADRWIQHVSRRHMHSESSRPIAHVPYYGYRLGQEALKGVVSRTTTCHNISRKQPTPPASAAKSPRHRQGGSTAMPSRQKLDEFLMQASSPGQPRKISVRSEDIVENLIPEVDTSCDSLVVGSDGFRSPHHSSRQTRPEAESALQSVRQALSVAKTNATAASHNLSHADPGNGRSTSVFNGAIESPKKARMEKSTFKSSSKKIIESVTSIRSPRRQRSKGPVTRSQSLRDAVEDVFGPSLPLSPKRIRSVGCPAI